MKKFIIITALLLIPFTAMAGMAPMTNSDMEATTGQLGLGIDVTSLSMDVALSTGVVDLFPATPIGMTEGVLQIGALDLEIGITSGQIDADIEITPVGMTIALGIDGLDIGIPGPLSLDVDCLADSAGDGMAGFPGDIAPMDLLNVELSDIVVGIGSLNLMVDVLPTVGLVVGTTQL